MHKAKDPSARHIRHPSLQRCGTPGFLRGARAHRLQPLATRLRAARACCAPICRSTACIPCPSTGAASSNHCCLLAAMRARYWGGPWPLLGGPRDLEQRRRQRALLPFTVLASAPTMGPRCASAYVPPFPACRHSSGLSDPSARGKWCRCVLPLTALQPSCRCVGRCANTSGIALLSATSLLLPFCLAGQRFCALGCWLCLLRCLRALPSHPRRWGPPLTWYGETGVPSRVILHRLGGTQCVCTRRPCGLFAHARSIAFCIFGFRAVVRMTVLAPSVSSL